MSGVGMAVIPTTVSRVCYKTCLNAKRVRPASCLWFGPKFVLILSLPLFCVCTVAGALFSLMTDGGKVCVDSHQIRVWVWYGEEGHRIFYGGL